MQRSGKVRDIYGPTGLLMVASDRISAFDRPLGNIPGKGKILTKFSLWWFDMTKNICPNHVIASPNHNSIFCKPCTPFPVEFVVRGYLTGSTKTSIWTHYKRGERLYCGHLLPDGMVKDERLETPIVTPTTKSDQHDELLSADDIVNHLKLMTRDEWNYCHDKAIQLYHCGALHARIGGYTLADTKFEFGRDSDGNILLIDEVLTPDSSRYWSFNGSKDPFDKDVLRKWYQETCDPYSVTDEELPTIPPHMVRTIQQR
jgi:phosphoribosylaminoimidazole-succinocarboxamide synthase